MLIGYAIIYSLRKNTTRSGVSSKSTMSLSNIIKKRLSQNKVIRFIVSDSFDLWLLRFIRKIRFGAGNVVLNFIIVAVR